MKPSTLLESILRTAEKFIPRFLYKFFQPAYHFALALLGAIIYRFPSKHLSVIAVTGTKGKSSTAELINAILEEAGHTTALLSTIRFKIGDKSKRNLFKMTVPGRFFLQHFLRRAVKKGCSYAIIEMTSEAAKFFRHKFIDFDTLVFTNLSPEHIEAHGSFEKYVEAKLRLRNAVGHSSKPRKTIVANGDDVYGKEFLNIGGVQKMSFTLTDAEPFELHENDTTLTIDGTAIHSQLVGTFNIYNILAAASVAKNEGVDIQTIKAALEKVSTIPGRVEKIEEGQSFDVIVDYAHTKDSLEQLYGAFKDKRKICVLGATGGGRDKRKRPEMGAVADQFCEYIILTNEDPYDEDPRTIVDELAIGIKNHKPEIIMDRRQAIQEAFKRADSGDVVLITGKGTDPYIMEAKGKKTPWSDSDVARTELQKQHV